MYDLRGISDVADFMLLGSGTSDRQIRAVASELGDLAGSHQQPRLGREADESARWIVLDFIDVIVHVFEAEARAYYDLEMLWGDAPLVRWEND